MLLVGLGEHKIFHFYTPQTECDFKLCNYSECGTAFVIDSFRLVRPNLVFSSHHMNTLPTTKHDTLYRYATYGYSLRI